MMMTFGKYTGYDLTEVPQGYLRWVLTQDIEPALRAEIRKLLGLSATPPEAVIKPFTTETVDKVLRRWRRAMSVDYPETVVNAGEQLIKHVLEHIDN